MRYCLKIVLKSYPQSSTVYTIPLATGGFVSLTYRMPIKLLKKENIPQFKNGYQSNECRKYHTTSMFCEMRYF